MKKFRSNQVAIMVLIFHYDADILLLNCVKQIFQVGIKLGFRLVVTLLSSVADISFEIKGTRKCSETSHFKIALRKF